MKKYIATIFMLANMNSYAYQMLEDSVIQKIIVQNKFGHEEGRVNIQPIYGNFPASEKYEIKLPAPVKIATPEAKKHRAVLKEGAMDGPNFAGHYTIVQWGCGASCVQFAIINAKNGAVFLPPFYVSITATGNEKDIPGPLQFKLDSKLLIVIGARNEIGDGVYFYKWDNNKLELLVSYGRNA